MERPRITRQMVAAHPGATEALEAVARILARAAVRQAEQQARPNPRRAR